MWQWINQNAQALSMFASFGTLFVWLFYAHLLLAGFRRQRQARILINQGWGEQLDSVCLVSNMSHEPIYIQYIFLTLCTTEDKEYNCSITDFDDAAKPFASTNQSGEVTRQGPLQAGGHMNLGTFRVLIRQGAKQHELSDDEDRPIATLGLQNFMITVLSSYGPEGGVIGARRQFMVCGENNEAMRPTWIDTRRMKKREAQRMMQHWLRFD